MTHGSGSVPRGPQQIRKNPKPIVLAGKGNGGVLLAHGEPYDACPVIGCVGVLRFSHR
jgi:hypothetical protein